MSIIIRVHPQGGRIGADGLNAQQRTFLRRSRKAVARQTYLANAGLRAALRQASARAAMAPQAFASPYGARAYGQAMVGAYSVPASYDYGYPQAYAAAPYYATASVSPFGPGFPFTNGIGAAYVGAYAPTVPYCY